MLRIPRYTCSFMYYFSELTRDITPNQNSIYILGHGDIYNEQFKQKIGTMMYNQCLHDLNVNDNTLDARTKITAFFNDQDSITLQFFHNSSANGQAPHGISLTKSAVLHGTGKYCHVNSTDYKTTALTNNDQRYIFVEPKRSYRCWTLQNEYWRIRFNPK